MIWMSYGFITIGCFFIITSILGFFRLNDFFQRIHAASLTDSLGLPLILIGVAIQFGWQIAGLKIVIMLGVWIMASTTSSGLLGKAALLNKQQND